MKYALKRNKHKKQTFSWHCIFATNGKFSLQIIHGLHMQKDCIKSTYAFKTWTNKLKRVIILLQLNFTKNRWLTFGK